ncbi:MAG: hypothetical protein MI861_05955, partial [Pirellulales bacterium]|nr:hypothetical protein [Pirellulales bacterium]
YIDFRTRVGGFINLADSDVMLVNAGNLVINNSDEDEEIAGIFEVGSGVRYQIGQALTIRAGVELWYLAGMATSVTQFNSVVSPTITGQITQLDDEILFTGAVVGAELRY